MEEQNRKKQDGFAGETMIVLPAEVFSQYIRSPLVRRLYLTDAGFFPHAAGHYRERPEGIEAWIFLCCTAGRGTVEVAGQRMELGPNQALCIPRLQGHRYWADPQDPWSLLWVHFKGTDGTLYPLEQLRVLELDAGAMERMERWFGQLFRTLQEDYTLGNFIYLSQLMGLILAETYAHTPPAGATPTQNRQLTRAIRLMYRSLSRELTLEELSRELEMSKSTLNTVFRQCTGHAPMDFFLRLKMKEACKLLRSGHRYIYETAQLLGYQDPYYFSRAFKKVVGVSPRAYQNGQNGPEDL